MFTFRPPASCASESARSTTTRALRQLRWALAATAVTWAAGALAEPHHKIDSDLTDEIDRPSDNHRWSKSVGRQHQVEAIIVTDGRDA